MKNFYFLIIISFFFVSCQAETEVYTPLFKCSAKLYNPYGVCTHVNRKGARNEYDSREKEVGMISSAGASFVRTDIDWNVCQPQVEGPFDFRQHLTMMESVKKKDLQVMGILWPTVSNRSFIQYEEYIKRNVALYKKSIKYWEVVNEADQLNKRRENFTSDVYVSIVRTANRIIKKENKHSKVLLSSVDIYEDKFYEEVFDAGVAKDFDILNIHWYANNDTQPEGLIGYLKWVQTLSSKYGVNKPAWLTETGCTTAPSFVTEDTQAQRLPRIFLISFALGMDKVFWYKSRDNGEDYYGLWHQDYTPKPAFFAYKTITEMCPDKSTRPVLARKDNVYVAFWKRPDKKKVWAFWTKSGERNIVVKAKGQYTCHDLKGNGLVLDEKCFIVTPNITYIVGANDIQIQD